MSGLNGKPARIVYYVPCLEVGGVEKNVHDLASHLPRDRFDPVVVWSCYWGPLGDDLRASGIPVLQLPLNQPRRIEESAAALGELQPRIFHSFSYREDDNDVKAAMAAGVPRILTNRPDMRFWDQEQTVRGWETSRNAGTHRITACSHAIAEVVRRVEGVEDSKVRVIYNGVTLPGDRGVASGGIREQLGIPAGDRVIGYVGNYRPEKGHATLLRAFRLVLDVDPLTHLVCCGSGPRDVKEGLDTLCAELGLRDRVHLLGLQSDVDRVYRDLDIYVQPSDTEGFSNALLEAMSQGLAVVATRVGGNVEAVCDCECGWLTPVGDPERMAEAITGLLRDTGLAARMGHAARERVRERFTFAHMLQKYVDLYQEVMAGA